MMTSVKKVVLAAIVALTAVAAGTQVTQAWWGSGYGGPWGGGPWYGYPGYGWGGYPGYGWGGYPGYGWGGYPGYGWGGYPGYGGWGAPYAYPYYGAAPAQTQSSSGTAK
jgi:hypothetical protein